MIKIKAPDIHAIRHILGWKLPVVAVDVTGPVEKPVFTISSQGEKRYTTDPEVAGRVVVLTLQRFIKKNAPKPTRKKKRSR